MPKKFIPTNIGFILADMRETKKKSQLDIAKTEVITRENLCQIENMRTNPSLHTFIKLMDYYGFDIEIINRKKPDKRYTLKFLNKI